MVSLTNIIIFKYFSNIQNNQQVLYQWKFTFNINKFTPMEDQQADTQQFDQLIRYHSQITGFGCQQPISLFQMTVSPYNYYLQIIVCDTGQRLDYYKNLAKTQSIVVCPQYTKTQKSFSLLIYNWFNLGEQNIIKTRIFFKYYNFTLQQWASQLKNNRGVIAENDLLYILKSLLSLAIKYCNTFNQHPKGFESSKIFISTDRRLKIYPFAFQYHGQQARSFSLNRSQSYTPNNKRSTSLSTSTLSMCNIDFGSRPNRLLCTEIDPSFKDILLILLEVLTFKDRDYFFSGRHNSMIWDTVKSVLNDVSVVGHLSESFVLILRDIAEGRLRQIKQLMERVECIIQERDIQCINLSMKSNKQAMGAKQQAVGRVRREQIISLKSKLAVSPFVKKLRDS